MLIKYTFGETPETILQDRLPDRFKLNVNGTDAAIVNTVFYGFSDNTKFVETLDKISLVKLLKYLKGVALEEPSDVWNVNEIAAAKNLRVSILFNCDIEEV